MKAPPLGLYVHLPWCVRKCPYCDFNSHAAPAMIPEDDYVDALLTDLRQESATVDGRNLDSIFIGGGTPSLFSPTGIGRLLEGIADKLPLAGDCEISLEANPGASDYTRFRGYRSAGVSRLSVGVQSFDDSSLRAIGRIHDGSDALEAVRAALRAGFEDLNIDLMYGLPGQTAKRALSDAETACSLGASHISHYQLTIEPNTRFAVRTPLLPAEDTVDESETRAREYLVAAGYTRYEVSAFAVPGHECRHNLNYWTFGDYLGIGAGAHAKVTDPATGRIERRAKQRDPKRYLRYAGGERVIGSRRTLQPSETLFEFALNAMRLVGGFELGLFEARTGLPAAWLQRGLARGQALGLVRCQGGNVQVTERGTRFVNDLVQGFMPDDSAGNC